MPVTLAFTLHRDPQGSAGILRASLLSGTTLKAERSEERLSSFDRMRASPGRPRREQERHSCAEKYVHVAVAYRVNGSISAILWGSPLDTEVAKGIKVFVRQGVEP